MFKDIFEAPEVEAARLAATPVGSKSHFLSTMPVNIQGWIEDMMIELPHMPDEPEGRKVVVVPYLRYADTKDEQEAPFPRKRHRGWWGCIIVASNDPVYPVGGNRLAIGEDELVRGTLRTFDDVVVPNVVTAVPA